MTCHFEGAQHNLEYSKQQRIMEGKTYMRNQELRFAKNLKQNKKKEHDIIIYLSFVTGTNILRKR